jgi:TRAP-type C4-dicarboxylate transport system substrate-binding protein
MKRRLVLALLLSAIVVVGTGSGTPETADAQQTHTLRLATLAPQGSSWMRVFNAWNASVKKKSGGKLKLRFYPGGVAGDERDFIRKMRAGQLDGAAVTSTGLGQVVRPLLVLQVPGLFDDYETLDRVRRQLDDELEAQFESNGYKLLGWGDVGKGRIFSNKPIKKPSDLKSTRPWAWRDDNIFGEFLEIVGATPVRLGVPEVYPALQNGMVDTVPASALAAVSLQWFTQVTHVTKQTSSVLIGATILKKEKFDALPPDLQEVLMSTSEQAHEVLSRQIRRDDERAYRTLLKRGITEVDLSPHQDKWDKVSKKVQNRLAGRLYPKSLLRRVKKAANR